MYKTIAVKVYAETTTLEEEDLDEVLNYCNLDPTPKRFMAIESGNKVWEDYPRVEFFHDFDTAMNYDFRPWSVGVRGSVTIFDLDYDRPSDPLFLISQNRLDTMQNK
jgi:hypothetical protein